MRVFLPGILGLVSVFMAGCGSDGGTGPDDTTPNWFPAEVGSQWTYGVSGIHVMLPSDTISVSGSLTYDIIGSAAHSSGFSVLVAVTNESLIGIPQGGGDTLTYDAVDTLYLHVTSSAVEDYYDLSSLDHDLLLQLPLHVGDTWWLNESDPNPALFEVMGLSEDVDVPVGSYSGCADVQQRREAGDSTVDFYYADGIGAVMYIAQTISSDQTELLTFALTSFSL
jgi:hypothetical protein